MSLYSKYQFIYYRGLLDFCNYQCPYCPFSKNMYSSETIEKDKAALNEFVDNISEMNQEVSVFFVPYGEALIHDYYIDAIIRLAAKDMVKEVAIQTNASFDFDIAFNKITTQIKEKLTLWCSYHPSQVNGDEFLEQCMKLSRAGTMYSVGLVADSKSTGLTQQEILAFREKLPDSVYLWFNYFDGKRMAYSEDEIDFFTYIDPYFVLELNKPKADYLMCSGGKESIFVDAGFKLSACNISRRYIVKEGNSTDYCRSRMCNCYLAYSNRTDIKLLERFSKSKRTRIPKRTDRKLLFLDIDGTLIRAGVMQYETIEKIKKLKEDYHIFLNTALPFEHAYKKCKSIWSDLEGGVFSNGADIRIFTYDYQLFLTLRGECIEEILNQHRCFKDYNQQHDLLKLTLFKNEIQAKRAVLEKNYHVGAEKNLVYLTNRYAGKENAIIRIKRFYLKRYEDIIFVGNSENDLLTGHRITVKTPEWLDV